MVGWRLMVILVWPEVKRTLAQRGIRGAGSGFYGLGHRAVMHTTLVAHRPDIVNDLS